MLLQILMTSASYVLFNQEIYVYKSYTESHDISLHDKCGETVI